MTDTGMVDRASHRAEDRRGHHLIWGFVGLATFGLAVLTVAFFSYRSASTDELRSLDDRADENAVVANRLADQVEQLGGTPVVRPPSPTADPDDPEQQDPEIQDPETQDPETQDPERQNPEDQDPSIPGASGTNGQDGATPPCMSEPAQCRGGDGTDGRDGQDGAQGPPGPTCPSGYTARSRTYDPTPVIPGGEETWWVCVADGGQT